MENNDIIDRLRATRELTEREYKDLLKFEETNDVELTADEIAERYNFYKPNTQSSE